MLVNPSSNNSTEMAAHSTVSELKDEVTKKLADINSIKPIESTSAVLLAAAFLIGPKCKKASDEYMVCKDQLKDPEQCIEQGKAVNACFSEVLHALNSHCSDSFSNYYKCLDMNNQNLIYCRAEEEEFVKCAAYFGLTKNLWKGRRDEEGFKEYPKDLPEADVFQFKQYVFRNKKSY